MKQELQTEAVPRKKLDADIHTGFKKAIQGYSTGEVDAAVKRMKEEIRFLTATNEEQSKEIQELSARNQQLERAAKSGDSKANNTENLLLIVESAKVTADQIIASARNEAEDLVTEAKIALIDANEAAQKIINTAETEAGALLESSAGEARTVLITSKEKSQEMIDSARVEANAIRKTIDSKLYDVKRTFSDISDISKSAQDSMIRLFADIDSRTGEALTEIRNVSTMSEGSLNTANYLSLSES